MGGDKIVKLEKENDVLARRLGEVVYECEQLRKKYEASLGELRFALDKIGKIEEQLAKRTGAIEMWQEEAKNSPGHVATVPVAELQEALKEEEGDHAQN